MSNIIWSLPVMFMLHDFEEIIITDAWQKKYASILQNSKVKPFNHWNSTDSAAIAILIEFLILSVVSLFSTIFDNYLVWFAFYVVVIIHYAIHYYLSIRFKHYIPGVVTGILFMPISIYILACSGVTQMYSTTNILLACSITLIFFLGLFRWLTASISSFHRWLQTYCNSLMR